MTDLGGQLQGPDKVEVSERLRERMRELTAQIESELAAGLPPESAVRYTAVLNALVAAERIVLLAGTSPDLTATEIY